MRFDLDNACWSAAGHRVANSRSPHIARMPTRAVEEQHHEFWRRKAALCVSGTPEGFCCLSGGYESAVSILRRHRWSCLHIRQAASRGSGEYRSGGGLIIGELANNEPVMAAEG